MNHKSAEQFPTANSTLLDWIRAVDLQPAKKTEPCAFVHELSAGSIAATPALANHAPLLRISIRFIKPKIKRVEVWVASPASLP